MIGRSFLWKRALLCAPVLLLLKGCALPLENLEDRPIAYGPHDEPRMQRERMLQAAWRGRPYNSLVEAFGAPKLVMNLPVYRPQKTTLVVYGSTDKVTKCIDTFTVVVLSHTEEVVVSDYSCR